MKRSPRQRAVKMADDECRELVMLKEPCCVTCGKPGRGDWSHYITKSHYNTRWDIRNTHNHCRRCHMIFHDIDPTAYHDFMIQFLGQEEFDKMRLLGNQSSNFSTQDIIDIAKDLKDSRLRRSNNYGW